MAMDRSFDFVISKLRAGDQDAAAEIFRKFLHRLIALANHQFDPRMHAKADPEEVVQSVYESFFRRDGHSPFDLSDWEALWALLANITVCKCINRRKYWKAGKRDVGREAINEVDPTEREWCDAIDRGPTPYHAMVLNDTLMQMMGKLPDQQRLIIEYTLQGYPLSDIATLCDCSERTINRTLKRIQKQLQGMALDNPRD